MEERRRLIGKGEKGEWRLENGRDDKDVSRFSYDR